MGKYIVKTTEASRIDKETGEIFQNTKSMTIVRKDPEPFFFTYSKEIMALYGMGVFNATTKVLWKLLEYAEFNTGKVYMNGQRIKQLLSECNIKKSSYYRAIKELEKAGVITTEGSTLSIKEDMFWKGDQKTRFELRKAKLRITYEPVFDD